LVGLSSQKDTLAQGAASNGSERVLLLEVLLLDVPFEVEAVKQAHVKPNALVNNTFWD